MLDKFYKHIQINYIALILIATLLVFCLWTIGYLLNGLFDYKFDLASCWVGFSAIATGILKYFIDSMLNSKKGEMPERSGHG